MDNSPFFTPVESAEIKTLSLETRIARQAYRLWESYGRPEENDSSIWMEAERQILSLDESLNLEAFDDVPAPRLRLAFSSPMAGPGVPDAEVIYAKKIAA